MFSFISSILVKIKTAVVSAYETVVNFIFSSKETETIDEDMPVIAKKEVRVYNSDESITRVYTNILEIIKNNVQTQSPSELQFSMACQFGSGRCFLNGAGDLPIGKEILELCIDIMFAEDFDREVAKDIIYNCSDISLMLDDNHIVTNEEHKAQFEAEKIALLKKNNLKLVNHKFHKLN